MRNGKRIGLARVIVVALLGSSTAVAEGLLDSLTKRGWVVRKSLTGSGKDAGLPASFSFENPDGAPDYKVLNMGIKAGSYFGEKFEGKPYVIRVSPTLELHRSSKLGDKVKKTWS
jgi:hypothetical protein